MDDRSTRIGDEERVSGYSGEDLRGYAAPTVPPVDNIPAESETRSAENRDNPDRRTAEIRQEIEHTREEMSETIDAIQEKLKPRNIVANAGESVRSAATERVKQMTEYMSEWNSYSDADSGIMARIRNNPLPAAMTVVGLAWLAKGGRSSSRGSQYSNRYDASYGSRGTSPYRTTGAGAYGASDADVYGSGAGGYGTTDAGSYGSTGSAAAKVSGAVESVTSGVQNATSQTAMAARRTTRRVQNKFQRALNDNPLMIGLAAAMVGAAIGAALPETESENRLVGDTRDAVVGQAQEMARGVANRVEQAATNVAETAGEIAGKAAKSPE